MEAKLLLVVWLIGVVYSSIPLFWLVIHPFAGGWRKMERSPYAALLPLWAVIIVALAWITWPWHALNLYRPLHPWWILTMGPALWFLSTALRTYMAIHSFGIRNLIGEPELRSQGQALVTTGLHARMRHPIYAAHLMMMAAWTIAGGLAASFVLLAISLFITFPLMVLLEERELEKRFGQSYCDYRQKVPLVSFYGSRKKPA
jgi:protein-S-isoprenylcysteine O-methyltransferase Ste14